MYTSFWNYKSSKNRAEFRREQCGFEYTNI